MPPKPTRLPAFQQLVDELEQLRQWCAAAGLTIRKENADTGTFVFITAERTA